MLLKSLELTNFLSYGEENPPVELGPLNVVIGTNGAGKTNLIEGVDLLRKVAGPMPEFIEQNGGVRHWLWKGAQLASTPATINAVVDFPSGRMPLRYLLSFTEEDGRFLIVDEKVENERPFAEFKDQPYFYYRLQNGSAVINALNVGDAENGPVVNTYGVREPTRKRRLQHEEIDQHASIIAQFKDPQQCPELAYLDKIFGKIQVYRNWHFGGANAARLPQQVDLPNTQLEADGSNLSVVLSRMLGDSRQKSLLVKSLQALNPSIQGIHLQIEDGAVQTYLDEGRQTVPATRLSDSTLRYLCLLAVLCQTDPGPLVCMDLPELGLHPDVLPTLGQLIMDASKRTQLIVTTQSDLLLDAFTETPEAVLVAEPSEAGTQLKRLDLGAVSAGLEQYKLGQLWMNGDLGGVRL